MILRRIALLALFLGGCAKPTPPAPAGVIDRATFIATYVDLRDGALATPLKVLSDEDRERILREHDVTEEQMLAFADARGGDPKYMISVWDEARSRLKPLTPQPDSTVH